MAPVGHLGLWLICADSDMVGEEEEEEKKRQAVDDLKVKFSRGNEAAVWAPT